jgi:hypothetical protein
VLNEQELRRPTFDEALSAPVVLADGQTWYLPKPVLRPIYQAGKVTSTQSITTDPQFDTLSKAVGDAEDTVAFNAIAELAAYMLGKNYALKDEDLIEILTYDAPAESGSGWPAAVMDVAWGRNAPRASSGRPG